MATFIYINDITPTTYQIGVDNDGFLESTPVAPQSPAPIYLNDSPGNTKTFLLSVVTEGGFGFLQTEEVAFSPGEDLGLTLISPNGTAYEVRVDVDGILATWPGAATEPVLSIAGHSSLLLRPDADWSEPVEESHEHLTDVLAAYNASEQRIRLRTEPRLRVAYRLTLLSPAEAGRFQSQLWSLQADRVLLPLWQDIARLEAAATSGDTFLELTAATRRFRALKYAMLWRDTGDYEIVQVEAVNPPGGGLEAHILQHGVSLVEPVASSWAADGRTWALPLLSARLEDAPELLHPNSRVATVDIRALSDRLPDPADPLALETGTAAIAQNETTAFDDDRGVLFKDFLLQYMPEGANVVKVYAVADAEFIAPEEFPCAGRIAFGDETLPVGILDTNGDEIVADSETGGFDGQFFADVDEGVEHPFEGSGLTIEQWIADARIQAATGHSLFLSGLVDLLNVRGVGFAIYFNFDFAPHDLTSPGSHSPFLISASSEHASFPAWKAFDGSDATYWLGTNGGSDWLQIDVGAGNSEQMHSYAVKVNTIPEPDRAPKDWLLEGSDDEIVWRRLHARSGETGWASGEVRTFTCDRVTTAYRFIRLRVTANNGDATFTQVQELLLYRDHAAVDVFDGSGVLPAPVAIPEQHGVTWAFPSAVTIAEPGDGHGLATGAASAWVDAPETWAYAYRDLDLWPFEPDRAGTLSAVWRRSLHHLDPGPGVRTAWDRAGVPLVARASREFILTDRDEIDRWLWFIRRLRGRRSPFWMPTWNRDLQMSANLTAGGTALTITDVGYRSGPFLSAARRHLALIVSEAEQYYREVVDAQAGAEGEEILTLDAPLPVTLNASRVMVSYLVLERMATDEPGLAWRTVEVASATLDTEELPVEVEVAGS